MTWNCIIIITRYTLSASGMDRGSQQLYRAVWSGGIVGVEYIVSGDRHPKKFYVLQITLCVININTLHNANAHTGTVLTRGSLN